MSLRERLSDFFEKLWHCEILRDHHVKMDSHGHCFRCNRLVDPAAGPQHL